VNAPLEQLVITLGLPAALRLVEAYGGTRMPYLPARAETMSAEHPVAKVVGLEAARELCRLWPGERPRIPLAAKFLRGERDRALRADAQDHTVPQLARKYEITERHVYRILSGAEAEQPSALAPEQSKLF
jgi:hypothetical protein